MTFTFMQNICSKKYEKLLKVNLLGHKSITNLFLKWFYQFSFPLPIRDTSYYSIGLLGILIFVNFKEYEMASPYVNLYFPSF